MPLQRRLKNSWLLAAEATRLALRPPIQSMGKFSHLTATSSQVGGRSRRSTGGLLSMGIKAVMLATVEVEDYGHTAHEVGKYTIQGEGGQVTDTGKYVVIWKQEAGQWKLHRDIWNSSRPAPGQ
jgi:ketosteroid isomerase-like protein